MRRSEIDPEMIISEVFQLRDDLSGLGEVVSNERVTNIYHHRCAPRRDALSNQNAVNKRP